MTRRLAWIVVTGLALAGVPVARAGIGTPSSFGLAVHPAGSPAGSVLTARAHDRDPGSPGEWLAQRTIEREWGPSDDSTYREVDVPGWKSEGFALAFSGAVPGAGQLYLGEGGGWAFLLAEALGWAGHWYEQREARDQWDRLARYVGDPNDTSATFSFARFMQNTGSDPERLRALWAGDRDAYFRAIHDDPLWAPGFGGATGREAQSTLSNMVDVHDRALGRQRLFDTGLFFNHLLAAIDAWRAARSHNAPLREEFRLELESRRRGTDREWRAALVRNF